MSRPRRDPELAKRIGARVKALRLETSMTQERLAWACAVEKGYVSDIEAGRKMPSLPLLATLAKSLDVELADVVALDMANPRLAVLDATRKCSRPVVDAVLRALQEDVP